MNSHVDNLLKLVGMVADHLVSRVVMLVQRVAYLINDPMMDLIVIHYS